MIEILPLAHICTNEGSAKCALSQLKQARKAGFEVDQVVTDHGTSGVITKLAEREGGKRPFDMLREGDTLVVRWVDRLGRNYQDVADTLRDFIDRGA